MARLPKSIIKKHGISKKAWRVFKGRKKSTKSRVSKPKRRRTYMTRRRRKKRGGGGKSITNTAMKWIRIGALVAPGVVSFTGPGTLEDKIDNALWKYTGYSTKHGTWDWSALSQGWGPYLAAVLTTYGIPKLAGIIRRL